MTDSAMKAAREWLEKNADHTTLSLLVFSLDEAASFADAHAAAAVAEERERCAGIADEYGGGHQACMPYWIGTAIRAEAKP